MTNESLRALETAFNTVRTALQGELRVKVGYTFQNKNYEDREVTVCFDPDMNAYFLIRTGYYRTYETINSKRVVSDTGDVKFADLFDNAKNVKHYEMI